MDYESVARNDFGDNCSFEEKYCHVSGVIKCFGLCDGRINCQKLHLYNI